MRKIGPEYECFSIPYWDITTDAGLFHDAFIYKSGLGGPGDFANDYCVDTENDGSWNAQLFPLTHVCHEEINPNDNPTDGCCLKRASGLDIDLPSASSFTSFIKEYNNFGGNDGFREYTFAGYHGGIHAFVGGSWANDTHMISRFASEDPIFYLVHSWLDYIFTVWKQCWKYNHIDPTDLDDHPAAYYPWPQEDIRNGNGIPSSGLDDKLYFVPMEDLEWWQEDDEYNPTARTTWSEHDWNVQYERGTFLARSHLSALCDNNWDTGVILENSDQTNQAIDALRDDDGESEVDRYQHKTWKYIERFMNDETMNGFDQKDYIQTWSAKTCNFQRQRLGKEPCYIPKDYEKCSNDDYERRDEITIDELLSKEGVSGNDCLEEVRIKLYAWARTEGMIYDLCMGYLDKYHICNAPKIDFMIDSDDDIYYNKLMANRDRMNKEDTEKNGGETNNNMLLNKVNYGTKKEGLPKIGGRIGDYPKFDVMGYLIAAFIIGGCAFLIVIRQCFNECNSTFLNNDKKQKNKHHYYGSIIEML